MCCVCLQDVSDRCRASCVCQRCGTATPDAADGLCAAWLLLTGGPGGTGPERFFPSLCRWKRLLQDVPDMRLDLKLDDVKPRLFPGFENWLLHRIRGPLVSALPWRQHL